MSVRQFSKDNYVFFEFHVNKCFLKCQASSKILLRGSLGNDDLYKSDNLDSAIPKVLPQALHVSSSSLDSRHTIHFQCNTCI